MGSDNPNVKLLIYFFCTCICINDQRGATTSLFFAQISFTFQHLYLWFHYPWWFLVPMTQFPFFPLKKKEISKSPTGFLHDKYDHFATWSHSLIKSGYISGRLFSSGSNAENSFPVTLSIFSTIRTFNTSKPMSRLHHLFKKLNTLLDP